MRFDTTQNMRLEQRMKLSPQMIQAMEILQLPLIALQERIESELISNPVLEMQDPASEADSAAEVAKEAEITDQAELVVRDDNSQYEDFQRLENFNQENDTRSFDGEDTYTPQRSSYTGDGDPKMEAMANTAAPEKSLYDYLIEQWVFVESDPQIRSVGEFIIESLDSDGYLREPLEDMAARASEPVTLELLKKVLPMIQCLEPAGIAARNLRECLLIQLDLLAAAGHDISLERELVRSFLRDIEMNHLPLIARKTHRSLDQIKAAIANLSRLNPRPGGSVGAEAAPPVTPDIIVEISDSGEMTITLADANFPALAINDEYDRMSRDKGMDGQAREFLQKNIRSASWLINAVRQRRRTIYRVAEEVFSVQREFFDHGRTALKPLPMADIAEKVGVHVATVSRAVAGKYVQTPRGVFPLRMFFAGGTTTDSGNDVAWDAVRQQLKEIIDAEDKTSPLNDDQLVEVLSDKGVNISRRTVAKYRKLMDIPTARQRRVY